MIENYIIGMIFEGFVLIPAFTVVFLSFRNFLSNRSRLALLLLIILTTYSLSIFFSWSSKILSVFFYTDYLEIREIPDPNTPLSWLLLRISYYRFTFALINIAILFSFKFKNRIFNEEIKSIQNIGIYIFGIFNIFYSIFIFRKELVILDVIMYLFTFVFECSIYIPLFLESFKNYKLSSHKRFKMKFLYLMIMSWSFLLVLFCLLLDRFFIFMGWGTYSLFYYVSWGFVLIGIITAYFGYLK